MTRPSTNTDIKLIEAGKKLARRKGLSALTARGVCAQAKVNLGMFHYHFKTRENFEHAVLKEIYAELMANISVGAASGASARERLKSTMCSLAKFVRENRDIMAVVFQDILAGKKSTMFFIKKNFTAHLKLIIEMITACRKEKSISDYPLTVVLPMLMPPVVLPELAVGIVEKIGAGPLFPVPFAFIKRSIISDKAIELRIELALRALSAGADK